MIEYLLPYRILITIEQIKKIDASSVNLIKILVD